MPYIIEWEYADGSASGTLDFLLSSSEARLVQTILNDLPPHPDSIHIKKIEEPKHRELDLPGDTPDA